MLLLLPIHIFKGIHYWMVGVVLVEIREEALGEVVK